MPSDCYPENQHAAYPRQPVRHSGRGDDLQLRRFDHESMVLPVATWQKGLSLRCSLLGQVPVIVIVMAVVTVAVQLFMSLTSSLVNYAGDTHG